MKMLTRQVVEDAITLANTLGSTLLPRFTVVELAQVLDIPLEHMIRCLAINRELVNVDAQKNIVGIGKAATNQSLKMTTTALHAWYVDHLKLKPEQVLIVKTTDQLSKSTNGIATFDPFAVAVCVYMTGEKDGRDVRATVKQDYGAEIAGLVTRLASIRQPPPTAASYFYGIPVNDQTQPILEKHGLRLFTHELAQKAMQSTSADGWQVYEVLTAGSSQRATPLANVDDEGGDDEGAQVNRRTKAELAAEREGWGKELASLGYPADTIKAEVLDQPKHKDAAAAYGTLVRNARKSTLTTTSQPPAPGVTQVNTPPPVSSSRRSTSIALPGTETPAAETQASTPPPTVASIKKDIVENVRQETGVAPQPQSPVAAQAPATQPQPTSPPPVAMAAAAGAGTPVVDVAKGLLDDLLGAAGQR